MNIDKKNPAAREGAGRAPVKFICFGAMNDSENMTSALSLQLAFLSRRVGPMDPATLAAIAVFAFDRGAR